MKLFVTGICGRLGRAIAVEAAAGGIEVIGLDRVPWPPDLPVPPGIRIVPGDFEDHAALAPLLDGCDALIHTAGPHGADLAHLGLPGFLRANVEGAARLLGSAQAGGVRRVALASTMEILGGRDWMASGAALLDESSAVRPDGPYATSRLLQEQLAAAFAAQHDIGIASLRLCGFGWVPDDQLGPRLLARSLAPADVARAMLGAASTEGLHGDVFLIAPANPFTAQEMVAAFADPLAVLEHRFPGAGDILAAGGHALEPTHCYPAIDTRRARRLLGWAPRLTFESWLQARGWHGP